MGAGSWWLPRHVCVVKPPHHGQPPTMHTEALYVHCALMGPEEPIVIASRVQLVAEHRVASGPMLWRGVGLVGGGGGVGAHFFVCKPSALLASHMDCTNFAVNSTTRRGASLATGSLSHLAIAYVPQTFHTRVQRSTVVAGTVPPLAMAAMPVQPTGHTHRVTLEALVAVQAHPDQTCLLCGHKEPHKFRKPTEGMISAGPLLAFIRGCDEGHARIAGLQAADVCFDPASLHGVSKMQPHKDMLADVPNLVIPPDKVTVPERVFQSLVWVHSMCLHTGLARAKDLTPAGGTCNVLTWIESHGDKFVACFDGLPHRPLAMVACGRDQCTCSYHFTDLMQHGWPKQCAGHVQRPSQLELMSPPVIHLLVQGRRGLTVNPTACQSGKTMVVHGWVVGFHAPSCTHTVLLDRHPRQSEPGACIAVVSPGHQPAPPPKGQAPSYTNMPLHGAEDIGRNVSLLVEHDDDCVRVLRLPAGDLPEGTWPAWARAPVPSLHSEHATGDAASAPAVRVSTTVGRRRRTRGSDSTPPSISGLKRCLGAMRKLQSPADLPSNAANCPDLDPAVLLPVEGGDLAQRVKEAARAPDPQAGNVRDVYYEVLGLDPLLGRRLQWSPLPPVHTQVEALRHFLARVFAAAQRPPPLLTAVPEAGKKQGRRRYRKGREPTHRSIQSRLQAAPAPQAIHGTKRSRVGGEQPAPPARVTAPDTVASMLPVPRVPPPPAKPLQRLDPIPHVPCAGDDPPRTLALSVLYASPRTICLRRMPSHALAGAATGASPHHPAARAMAETLMPQEGPDNVGGTLPPTVAAVVGNMGSVHAQALVLGRATLRGPAAAPSLTISQSIWLGGSIMRGRGRGSLDVAQVEDKGPPVASGSGDAHITPRADPASTADNGWAQLLGQ